MSNELPLKGYRVLEMTTFVAGPSCARILADWGAEVIKIENVEGDVWRYYGTSLSSPASEEENPQFDVYNANKRGLVLNMKKPEAIEIFMKLLATADVFLTSTRIEPLKKMGIDYDSLKVKFPKLIFATVTGYGERGKDSVLPGFDVVAFFARTGILGDLVKVGEVPLSTASGVGDAMTGMALYSGICAALLNRERTGKGDKVQVSLFGAAIWYASCLITDTQKRYGKVYPQTRYSGNPNSSPYRCKDGEWVMMSLLDYNKHAALFYKLIGREDYVTRFPGRMDMVNNAEEIMKTYEEWFAKYNGLEAAKLVKDLDIVCDIMPHFIDVATDEQAWANNYLEKVPYNTPGNEGFGAIPNTPLEFGGIKKVPFVKAPLLGEHSAEIIKSLGYTDDEVKTLIGNKVTLVTPRK